MGCVFLTGLRGRLLTVVVSNKIDLAESQQYCSKASRIKGVIATY